VQPKKPAIRVLLKKHVTRAIRVLPRKLAILATRVLLKIPATLAIHVQLRKSLKPYDSFSDVSDRPTGSNP